MREKIYAYLMEQKTGVPSEELVEHVLKIQGASPTLSKRLINTAISGDRRFSYDENNHWKIEKHQGTPLEMVEFSLISMLIVNTTGRAKTILEVSACKIKDEKVTGQFHTYVKPVLFDSSSMKLPFELAEEIKNGIPLEKAAHSLSQFFGESVIAGFHMQYAIQQLNLALQRSNTNNIIENQTLCLHHLTKKLHPNLQAKTLNDIATYLKLPQVDTLYTEEKIHTITEIFFHCTALLKKQGFGILEDVIEFQYPNIKNINFDTYAFDKVFLRTLPQTPGIYCIKDKEGTVLYIGKANNLRLRINSYFLNTINRSKKTTEMLNRTYSIDFEIAGSELEALLMEYKNIKKYLPEFNRQQEVHERPSRYGNLKNFIIILPASVENCLKLFFVKEGFPIQKYDILKNTVNYSDVENILTQMYYGSHPKTLRVLSDRETGENDIVSSWIAINRDCANYINVDTINNKQTCVKLLKDYIRDEETLQKKLFRV